MAWCDHELPRRDCGDCNRNNPALEKSKVRARIERNKARERRINARLETSSAILRSFDPNIPEIIFHGTGSARRFHATKDCSGLKNGQAECVQPSVVVSRSPAEAFLDDYTPCKVCFPSLGQIRRLRGMISW